MDNIVFKDCEYRFTENNELYCKNDTVAVSIYGPEGGSGVIDKNNNIDLTVAELRHWDEIEAKRNQTIDKIFKIKAKQSGLSNKQYRSLILGSASVGGMKVGTGIGGKEFDPFDTTGEDYSSIYEKRVQALTALIKQENSVSNIGTAKQFLSIVQAELAYREKVRKEYEAQQAAAKVSYDIEKKKISEEFKQLNANEKVHKEKIIQSFASSNEQQTKYIQGKQEELTLLEQEQQLLKENFIITEQTYKDKIAKEQRKRGSSFKPIIVNDSELLSQDKEFQKILKNKRTINKSISNYESQLTNLDNKKKELLSKQQQFENNERKILEIILYMQE